MNDDLRAKLLTLKDDIRHQVDCLENNDQFNMWDVLQLDNWKSMLESIEEIEKNLK